MLLMEENWEIKHVSISFKGWQVLLWEENKARSLKSEKTYFRQEARVLKEVQQQKTVSTGRDTRLRKRQKRKSSVTRKKHKRPAQRSLSEIFLNKHYCLIKHQLWSAGELYRAVSAVPVAPSRDADALNHRHDDLSEENEEEEEEIEGAVRPETEGNIERNMLTMKQNLNIKWKTSTFRKSETLPWQLAENKICWNAKITQN